MYEFNYHRPGSLEEARKLLAGAEDGLLMAGGQTLLQTMRQRLAMPSDVVDIGAIAELRGVRREGDEIVVGAMTRHNEVAKSDEVRKAIPALAVLASGIGDNQVRNMGTLAGSIANSDPAADYPAAIVGLGATVVTTERSIAADDFFTAMFETALDEGEVIVAVRFPIPKRAGYVKFAQPASRYALVGVMVAETADGVRVGVTGAGPCAFRVPEMEQALAKDFRPDAIDGITVDDAELNEDLHASAAYRANLVSVIARRAVARALGGH